MNKILIVTGTLARNGTETFIMNIYRNINLKEYKINFLLAKIDPTGYADEAKKLGSKFYCIPPRRQNPIKHYYRLWRFFKTHAYEYNVIHYCGCSLSENTEVWMAKHFGIPIIIVHAHSSMCHNKFTRFMHYWHKKNITHYANRYLACSESAYQWFYDGIVPRENVEIIHNGIDIDKFLFNITIRQKIRSQYKISNDTLVFGHIGYFSDVKNHEHLINVFGEIVKQEPKSQLILVGDGENMSKIKKQVKNMGLENKIIFAGKQIDVSPFLQAMDCFIMPSLYEGLPFVLIEAQAAGLPIVASSEISNESNITGNIIFIDLKENISVWATETIKIVRNYKRKDTRQIMVNAGYAIKDTVKKMEQIYSGNNKSKVI